MKNFHSRLPILIALSSIVVNFFLFGVKGWVALGIGSLALLSDSVHTLTDSASSVAVYLGIKIAEKPADDTHPFGHGRAEQIAVLSVGLILMFAAMKFFSDGLISLLTGTGLELMDVTRQVYIFVFATAVVKEVMAEVCYFVGRKEDSEPLKADAWHHRSDAITTMLVLGAIYGSKIGYEFLDPVAGIGIALLLGYIGFSYSKKAAYKLLGSGPSKELLDKIKKESRDFEGVKDIHHIHVHDYGNEKAISLHMEPSPGTAKESHDTAHKLSEYLEKKFAADVEVHFEPWRPPLKKVKTEVKKIVGEREGVIDIHKIELSESDETMIISFHLVVPRDIDVKKGHDIATEIERDIIGSLRDKVSTSLDVQVHVEPCEQDCDHCSKKDR